MGTCVSITSLIPEARRTEVAHVTSLHYIVLRREDLAKPAQTLFLHNLTGILETAVRATNAQYDDADILKRLDVRLLEVLLLQCLFTDMNSKLQLVNTNWLSCLIYYFIYFYYSLQ